MTAIVFGVIALGLLALPFVPLLAELCASRDVAPLPIDEDMPIDASLPAPVGDRVTYVAHIDVDRAVFTGVIAASDIRVHATCRFRHLYGMPIVFGAPRERPPEPRAQLLRPIPIARLLERVKYREGATRYLVFGDLTMPANAFVEANFVVNGALQIGESSCVHGNIKAHTVKVCAGAKVRGAVFAHREIMLAPDSAVDGVLSVDGELSIEHAGIGSAENAVSVSASQISIRGGACVYGQLTAARSGRFDGAGQANESVRDAGRQGGQ